MATDSSALLDPILASPVSAARVAAAALSLVWQPSENATSYLVQVATDPDFSNEALLAEVETEATRIDLDGAVELGQTYYWRVMACRGGAESSGERVESFIPVADPVATDAAVMVDTPPAGNGNTSDPARTDPDAAEDLGPVAELFKAGGAAAAAEATGSSVGADTASEMGVEPEGVASAQILAITLSVLVVIAVLVVIVFNWKATVREEAVAAASARVPGTSVNAIRHPLLYETEMQARRALDHYEVVNDASGRYRIPIQEAMEAQMRAASGTAAPGATPPVPRAAARDSAAAAASPIPDLTGR